MYEKIDFACNKCNTVFQANKDFAVVEQPNGTLTTMCIGPGCGTVVVSEPKKESA